MNDLASLALNLASSAGHRAIAVRTSKFSVPAAWAAAQVGQWRNRTKPPAYPHTSGGGGGTPPAAAAFCRASRRPALGGSRCPCARLAAGRVHTPRSALRRSPGPRCACRRGRGGGGVVPAAGGRGWFPVFRAFVGVCCGFFLSGGFSVSGAVPWLAGARCWRWRWRWRWGGRRKRPSPSFWPIIRW